MGWWVFVVAVIDPILVEYVFIGEQCKQWQIQGGAARRPPPSQPRSIKKKEKKSHRFKNVEKLYFFKSFLQNVDKIYEITNKFVNFINLSTS